MNPDQRLLAISVVICSSLYLCGVFVASLLVQHGVAWKVVLASMGMCSLSYALQIVTVGRTSVAAMLISVASWAFGIAAGILVVQGI